MRRDECDGAAGEVGVVGVVGGRHHFAHARAPGEDGRGEQSADGRWGASVGKELMQRTCLQ